MPHFFFDSDDGNFLDQDYTGVEIANAEAARKLAIRSSLEMMLENRCDSDQRSFKVSVRDETGTTLYSVAIDLIGEWAATGREQPANDGSS